MSTPEPTPEDKVPLFALASLLSPIGALMFLVNGFSGLRDARGESGLIGLFGVLFFSTGLLVLGAFLGLLAYNRGEPRKLAVNGMILNGGLIVVGFIAVFAFTAWVDSGR